MSPVDQIKDRLNIVDVVSMYVTLTPAGKNLKGKSPFTNEKTPSFFVSPEKGLYHCFSTGKGGDIFTFVQEMEGLDFKGALKVLADRAGIKLGQFDGKGDKEKDTLYEIVESATKYFEEELLRSSEAKKYLESRGVEEKTIQEFRLGYAPNGWRGLYDRLKNKFEDKYILLAGLGKKSEKGIYDTFRDRVMFPIMDSAGRPIAFSGRILHPDEKSAKYVNSPDTPLFSKSDVLFALDKAKNYIRKYNFTTLVEGQFDVIMLHQAGFKNTVGVSGTALSDSLMSRENRVNNLGLVKRLSNNLVLSFDSDEAGIKATRRSADIALALGMDVKVIAVPGAKDPAEFLKDSGKEEWSKVLKGATHVIEFLTGKIKEKSKDERSVGRKIIEEVLPQIAILQSDVEKSFFVKKVSDMTGIREDVLWKDLEKVNISSANQEFPVVDLKKEKSRKDEIERKLMAIFYNNENDGGIRDKISKIMSEEKFEILKNKLAPLKDELYFEVENLEEGTTNQKMVDEMLKNIEEEYLSEEVEEIRVKIGKAESSGFQEEAEKFTGDYQKLLKRLNEIKNSRHLNKY